MLTPLKDKELCHQVALWMRRETEREAWGGEGETEWESGWAGVGGRVGGQRGEGAREQNRPLASGKTQDG